uniref:Uncharacterized protein n=1 Tax=Arundo donax TaxID=35708 RepID=A0A0A8ZA81_ARUDO
MLAFVLRFSTHNTSRSSLEQPRRFSVHCSLKE